MFDESIDGGSSCHPVVRTEGGVTYRVHDIAFQTYGEIDGDC